MSRAWPVASAVGLAVIWLALAVLAVLVYLERSRK